MAIELIPVREDELVTLIREIGTREPVNVAFGPSGVALKWDTDKPMPLAIERLGFMRGVLNENTDGAGV